ncbi:ParA family protein [Rossellomorea vietnamensis]|uniref:ParA family protein n=1 Tax=Rossellomorea vietnamensis TaxID=218284 RepID=A0A5D4M2Y6_9BACI|nr:ParA family protein [Rossellomorea vietnamensis]TYR95738.1 ParA family protein [Rossellomorea vietnamensis]
MTRIFSVFSAKGGVLKSTTSNAIGSIANMNGKRALLIDLDSQSNQRQIYGIQEPKVGTKEVLLGEVKPEDAVVNIHSNLDLIPSTFNMSLFQYEILTNIETYPNYLYLIQESLGEFIQQYDVVVFDCPPNFSIETLNTYLVEGIEVIIPVQPEGFSVQGIKETIGAIERYRTKNPSLKITGLLTTLYDRRSKHHAEIFEMVKKFASMKSIRCFDTVITKSVKVPETIYEYSLPIMEVDEKHAVTKQFKSFYKELMGNE